MPTAATNKLAVANERAKVLSATQKTDVFYNRLVSFIIVAQYDGRPRKQHGSTRGMPCRKGPTRIIFIMFVTKRGSRNENRDPLFAAVLLLLSWSRGRKSCT